MASVRIVVYNDSPIVDEFGLRVDGLDGDWYSLARSSVSLFPGEQTEVRLELRVPPAAAGGTYPFTVVATSRDNPAESTLANTTCAVGTAAQTPIELTIVPERQSARGRVVPVLGALAGLPVALQRRLPLALGGLAALALLVWFLASPGRQSGGPPEPGEHRQAAAKQGRAPRSPTLVLASRQTSRPSSSRSAGRCRTPTRPS